MPVDIQRFTVALAHTDVGLTEAYELGEGEGYDVHTVAILHADQLLAEQAGPRYGLGADIKAAPMAYTTLWCWAALVRMGIDPPEFPIFKGLVISIDPVKAAAADPTGPSSTATPLEAVTS